MIFSFRKRAHLSRVLDMEEWIQKLNLEEFQLKVPMEMEPILPFKDHLEKEITHCLHKEMNSIIEWTK